MVENIIFFALIPPSNINKNTVFRLVGGEGNWKPLPTLTNFFAPGKKFQSSFFGDKRFVVGLG